MTDSSFDPGNRLIAAIDVATGVEAAALVERLAGVPSFIKIGLELFVSEGPGLVRDMADAGHRIMLDLKLHDIPATVERATRQVAGLGVELLTVHLSGGREMLEAARRGAEGRVRLLGVTVLTSLNDVALSETLGDAVAHSDTESFVSDIVLARARLAAACNLFGVVASPHEVSEIRSDIGAGLSLVTPGVRPMGSSAGDQKRVATPAQAREWGADLIVVGRPIRDAADPAAAAAAILSELPA